MFFPFLNERGTAAAFGGEVFEKPDGWYWWTRRPGENPTCAPVGPFKTSSSAVDDAQSKGPAHDLL